MQSFRSRLLIRLLPVLMGVILLVSGISVYVIRKQTYDELNDRLNALGSDPKVQHLLAASVESLRLHEIEGFANNALLMPDTAYFALYDTGGRLVYEDGNEHHGEPGNLRRDFPLVYNGSALDGAGNRPVELISDARLLGHFTLEFHTGLVDRRVTDTLESHLIVAALLLLLITIAVIRAFRSSIGEPLEQLSVAMKASRHAGGKGLVEWHSSDELGSLVDAYNGLVDEQSQLLNEAQRLADIGSWDLDVGTGRMMWSDQMYRICGVSAQMFVPGVENLLALIHDEDRDQVRSALNRITIANIPYDDTVRLIRVDDTLTYVHIQARASSRNNGRADRIVGSVMDVTEKKLTEAALIRSEQRCRSLFEQAPEAIFIANENDRIIDANPAACELLGYSHEQLLKKTVSETRMLEHAVDEHTLDSAFEGIVIHSDGHRIPVEIITKPLAEGSAGLTLSTVRDVTERKRAEHQLRHAQKIEALGNIAGGLAHSLNNLLLPILITSEMLAKSLPAHGPDRERIQRVILAAKQAKQLVARVLAFGRREELKREYFDVASLVRECLSLLKVTMPPTVTIKADLSDSSATIFADSALIETIIMDMAANAAASMKDRPGKFVISLDRQEIDSEFAALHKLDKGSYARLVFTDAGTGMDNETMAHIFEPFYTTKGVGEGTGLGLSSVYGIVMQHGGAIEVQSKPGSGSTFTIYLPIAADSAQTLSHGVQQC